MLDKILFIWLLIAGCIYISRYDLWKVFSLGIVANKEIPIKNFDSSNLVPLRGLMAVMIIFCHLSTKTGGYLDVCYTWGEAVVSVFLFISGYGYMKSYITKSNYLDGFLKKRFSTIVIPYLACIVIFQIVRYLMFGILPFFNIGGGNFDITDELLPTSWYIVAIIILSIAFYFAALIFKNKYAIISILFLFTFIYYVTIETIGFGQWWNDSIFAFNAGTIFILIEPNIKKLLSNHFLLTWFALILTLMLVYFLIPHFFSSLFNRSVFEGGYYFAVTNLILSFLVVCCIIMTGLSQLGGILTFLGKISYYIYLVQGAVIYFTSRCFQDYFVIIISTITISILVAYIIYLCNKFVKVKFN